MSSHTIALARSAALMAVFGAGMIAAPLVAVQAQTTHTTVAARQQAKAETVDQRITMLHSALKITPAEETDWQAVAQTMRDNAAAMEKLAADKASQTNKTAVEDLQTYEQFAQAHVDGLHKLVATFQTLYGTMPPAQQKLADQVFQQSRQKHEAPKAS